MSGTNLVARPKNEDKRTRTWVLTCCVILICLGVVIIGVIIGDGEIVSEIKRYEGRVIALERLAKSTEIYFENGSTINIDEDMDLAIGSEYIMEKEIITRRAFFFKVLIASRQVGKLVGISIKE